VTAASREVDLGAATGAPVVVRTWRGKGGRVFTAARVPRAPDDATPWSVYEGVKYLGNCGNDKIPSDAAVLYPEGDRGIEVVDGVYYAVIVDRQEGVGVRNSPLTARDPDRPWAVSLPDVLEDRVVIDSLPEQMVDVVRALDAGL